MLSFILNRLFQSILVMAVVSAISFSLFNFVGDPVDNMVGQDASREDRLAIRNELGLLHASKRCRFLLKHTIVEQLSWEAYRKIGLPPKEQLDIRVRGKFMSYRHEFSSDSDV